VLFYREWRITTSLSSSKAMPRHREGPQKFVRRLLPSIDRGQKTFLQKKGVFYPAIFKKHAKWAQIIGVRPKRKKRVLKSPLFKIKVYPNIG